jgi:hypothetical protein
VVQEINGAEKKDTEVSERGLRNVKQKIRNGNGLKNTSKVIKINFKKILE